MDELVLKYPLRYVVLRHEGIKQPHFDFLFETAPGSALASVRLPDWPAEDFSSAAAAPDHRRAYLDYEGPISGGRGRVKRFASGRLRMLSGSCERMWQMELDTLAEVVLPRHGPALSAK